MNNNRTNFSFPLKIPSPKFRISNFLFCVADDFKTSKGRGNFLLQHETREMGVVVTVVKQMRGWNRIINCYPDSIAFFQIQRRLEGQRTPLINDSISVILLNITHPDYIPVQKKTRI